MGFTHLLREKISDLSKAKSMLLDETHSENKVTQKG